jgi:hypothetical protein
VVSHLLVREGLTSLRLRHANSICTGETAVNLPESYPLFNIHQTQNKLSAPYWTDGLDREQDLPTHSLPVDGVVGALSQSANDTTKPYIVDEGALRTYVARYFIFTFDLETN